MENAKTIFTSLSDKARKAELAKRQLQELKTMAAKCTPVMHLAPSGSGGESRTLEDNVLRIEAAEKELQAIIADYVAAKLRVMELIRMLPDTCQQVMQLRFVEGYTKKQISEKLRVVPIPGFERMGPFFMLIFGPLDGSAWSQAAILSSWDHFHT